MTDTAKLKHEFEYYQAHKEELLEAHRGRFIVIKDETVIGVFDDRLEAIQATAKEHALGTFLVQEVVEGGDEVRFHSRVAV